MEVTLQNLNEQEKEQVCANRIHECRNSPLTVEKWCKEHEIKPATYYFWQKKVFNKVKNEPKFTEILVGETQEHTTPTVAQKS
ncbi:MAG: hypothetical protein R3Y63_12620 [Eubacteriales bacterium]